MQREKLGSRLGFLLLSAGSAIGIGNVWKFPYMAGSHGGAIFVLIYLFFLVILGLPVMTMEFSLGRASRRSPAKLYDELAPKGTKWHIHGKAAVIGNYLLMMFYTTVSGWMIKYFVDMATGKFENLSKSGIDAHYNSMLANPLSLTIYMGIVVLIGAIVCSFSLQGGLERITKYMMIALLAIMIVLAVNSMFMDGGSKGLEFYLVPNLQKVKEIGIGQVIVGAMNQAFFTLSLGIGAMVVFGSYIGKERALAGESLNVALLDTIVAVCSGLIIFPACSAYGVDVDSGTSLIFKTLPNIFNNIPLGRLWGALFFVFMSFAALSTIFATFENIMSCTSDLFGWTRKKSAIINGILLFVLSMPCVLGFNILSGVTPFGKNTNIMDLEDFLVSNILLPLGSLIFVLFCTRKNGWGWDNFITEANTGKGLKLRNGIKFYVSYILPVIIIVLFLFGIYNFFK